MFRGILIRTGLEKKSIDELRLDEIENQSQIDRIEIIQRSTLFMGREKIDPIEFSLVIANLRRDIKASNFISYCDAVIAEHLRDYDSTKIHLLEAYKNNTPASYVEVKAQAAFGLANTYKCKGYRHHNLSRATAWLIEAIRLKSPEAIRMLFADSFVPLKSNINGQLDYKASYALNYTMLAILFALDMKFNDIHVKEAVLFKVINFSVLQSFQLANEQDYRLNHLADNDSGLKRILLMAALENPYVCFDLLKNCFSLNVISQDIFINLSELLSQYVWEADLCDEINRVLIEMHLSNKSWEKAKSCLNELTLLPINYPLNEFLKISDKKIKNNFCFVLLEKYQIMQENEAALICLLSISEVNSVEQENLMMKFMNSVNIESLQFDDYKKYWQVMNKFKSALQTSKGACSSQFREWFWERFEKTGKPIVLLNKSILFAIKLLRACIHSEMEKLEMFATDNSEAEITALHDKLIEFEKTIKGCAYRMEKLFLDFTSLINTSKNKLSGEFVKVFDWCDKALEKTASDLNLHFDIDGLLANRTVLSICSSPFGLHALLPGTKFAENKHEIPAFPGITLRQD